MPLIILTEPFIHHHKGSVFHLSDAIGYSGWDEDDRVRDRQPFHDKRSYILPDNGKGMPVELPLSYTILCPDHIFENVDLKSGPCRITSVSEGLRTHPDDPWYATPLPVGRGKLLLNDSSTYLKNMIVSDGSVHPLPAKSIIVNLISNESVSITDRLKHGFELDLSDFDPGFYKVELLNDSLTQHYFTVIKCFPLVVDFVGHSDKFIKMPALW
jgi:hypothetical protein